MNLPRDVQGGEGRRRRVVEFPRNVVCCSLRFTGFPAMFPFWVESFQASIPQLLTLLAAALAVVMHATIAHQ